MLALTLTMGCCLSMATERVTMNAAAVRTCALAVRDVGGYIHTNK